MNYPACFKSLEAYESYREAAKMSKDAPHYCRDCSRGYQATMEAKGRCSNPKTRLYEYERHEI